MQNMPILLIYHVESVVIYSGPIKSVVFVYVRQVVTYCSDYLPIFVKNDRTYQEQTLLPFDFQKRLGVSIRIVVY